MTKTLKEFLALHTSPECADVMLAAEEVLLDSGDEAAQDLIDSVLMQDDQMDGSAVLNELDYGLQTLLVNRLRDNYIIVNPDEVLKLEYLTQILECVEALDGYDDYSTILEHIQDNEDPKEAFLAILFDVIGLDPVYADPIILDVSGSYLEKIEDQAKSREAVDVIRTHEDQSDIVTKLKDLIDTTDESNLALDLIRNGMALGLSYEDYEPIIQRDIFGVTEDVDVLAKSLWTINVISEDATDDPQVVIQRTSLFYQDLVLLEAIFKAIRNVKA